MPEQETLQMLARLTHDAPGRCPCPNHISHRFVGAIRNPDWRQFARPMQFRQHERIAAAGLHADTGLYRHERGRNDHALMPEFGQMTVHAVAAGACLIAEVQHEPIGAQLSASFRT